MFFPCPRHRRPEKPTTDRSSAHLLRSSPRTWSARARDPMVARSPEPGLALLSFLVLALLPMPTAAAELGEADVVALAREHVPSAIVADHAVSVAEAELVEAGLLPNPALAWGRESVGDSGSGREREDELAVTLPLDLSTRRTVRRHLGAGEVAAARAAAARERSAAVAGSLELFYRVVAEQQRSSVEAKAAERLAEAARIVRRRREEGTASGYDQTRIEIDAELAASTLRETRERARLLAMELALLLGLDPDSTTFSGNLDAAGHPENGDGPVAQAGARLSLRSLRTAEEYFHRADRRSAFAWLPPLTLSAGPRSARGEDSRSGYVAGVSVELPLFAHGQELRALASARHRHAAARAESEERLALIEHARAVGQLEAARGEAARFAARIADRVERLERAAESGYREGRRSIVELLDARRARTAVEIRHLEIALSAKHAEVALRAVRGEFE